MSGWAMWTASLSVVIDPARRMLSPVVTIGGDRTFARGALCLELLDPAGELRHLLQRSLRPDQLGSEIALGSIAVPPGASAAEVEVWPWEIAVETDGVERIRWRRYLQVPTGISAEGEIEFRRSREEELPPKIEDEGWGPEAPWDARDSERLLRRLVDEGVISPARREQLLNLRHVTGMTVERRLIEEGPLDEREVLHAYCDVSGCELVDVRRHPVDPEAAALIPERVARHFGLVAIAFDRGRVTLAMSDPQRDRAELAPLWDFIGEPAYIVVATRADVIAVLNAISAADQPARILAEEGCTVRDVGW